MEQVFVEIWGGRGPELVPLQPERVTVGRASNNVVQLVHDPKVSRLHLVLEHYSSGWSVRDMGSSNGTSVNGERLHGEHRLSSGDEIVIGGTRLVFRARDAEDGDRTLSTDDGPPEITKRELDVLRELCRPLVGPSPFAQPATIQEIADELVVSKAAVKFHLANLYDKFGIYATGPSRRAFLANEAVNRGAVSIADLKLRQSERR